MAEIDNYDKSVDVGLRNLDKLVIDPMLKERLSDAQDLWRKLLPPNRVRRGFGPGY